MSDLPNFELFPDPVGDGFEDLLGCLFAAEADARSFAASHGGKVLRFGEVTLAMVALDGGALHDQRM